MPTNKKRVTGDTIDVKEQLTGPIKTVIGNLQKLAEKYPEGEIEIGTHIEYGDTYEHAYLNYTRDQTPLEIELDDLNTKCRRLQTMRADAAAFAANDTPYPKAKQMAALKAELGYLALAPMRGTLCIEGNRIVVWDMMRGARTKTGEWTSRRISVFGGGKEEAKFAKQMDDLDAAYIA